MVAGNMKKNNFNVGDKVFAKVKGYPAWPAIILEDHGLKYNVKFYGTGETAIVKTKDLYYYLKYKSIFTKSSKRKDYNDAIEEIERAIEETGTDGNDGSAVDVSVSSDLDVSESNNETTKSNKRKRSSASEKSTNIQLKKRALSTNDVDDVSKANTETPTQINDVIKSQDVGGVNINNGNDQNDKFPEQQEFNKTYEESPTVNDAIVNNVNRAKVKIITDEHVKAILSYVEHVKKNKLQYEKKPAEKVDISNNEVIIAKLKNGDCVAVKYNRENIPNFNNECERAEYEEAQINKILLIKKELEEGTINYEEKSDLLEANFKLTEKDVKKITDLDLMDRKKEKLKWLKKESSLIELDARIKGCLGLDKADPNAALQHLTEMAKMDIEPLMLLKHPHVVDMVKRLRRYIGNVKEWNMSEEQRTKFEREAELVREKAEDVYMCFSVLFKVSDPSLFWDIFSKLLDEFKIKVHDLKECQIFALCSEPGSRETFLNKSDDEQDMETVAAELERSSSRRSKEANSEMTNSETDPDMDS